MKSTFFQKSIASVFVLGMIASTAFSEKMDLDTHTAVISRLETIVKDLDNNDASKVPSSLRLADLLADRARLKSLKETEQNCNNCLKAKQDRLAAVSYYDFAIPRLTDDIRGSAMLQKAHLHFFLGQLKETENIYNKITKEGHKRHGQDVLGQAHASYGDLYFQKADFKKAKAEYERALMIEQTPNKGLVHYRLAWCMFNLDQVASSIAKMEMILQTPKLTEVNNGDGPVQDESFKVDVAKDLASFYARTTVTRATVDKLIRLSPQSEKITNISFLGSELDRLGKKKQSALVWLVYLDQSGKDKNALEAQIRLMRLRRDTGDVKSALVTFENVRKIWEDDGCDDKCDQYQAQIKNWIIDWNREEKKQQTLELTQAFLIYSNIFPHDEEMFFSGAVAAQQRKQFIQAFELYKKAADAAHKKSRKLDAKQAKSVLTIRDQSLIAEMDIAETLKNPNMRLSAYVHYLELQPKGEKDFEVRYQLAQLKFEAKDYEKSANEFRALALEKTKGKRELQKTAATMSIESLIRTKNEPLIQKWSLEYSKAFIEARNEFELIHRKAVLNSTAANINSKSASNSDLANLKTVSLAKSTPEEKVIYWKNVYLLALQLHNFPEAKLANVQLLSLKDIKANDHEEAVRNRIWLAELELDFKTAYAFTKQQSGKMTADRALKLLWLAEMAGLNGSKHEDDVLKLSKDRTLRATVIVGKVQRSVHPMKTMQPYLKELSQSPDVLSRLALEVYSRTNNREVLEKAFSFKSVKNSVNGALIARLLFYRELNKDISNLQSLRLQTRNDNQLKKSLDARLKALSQFEKHVNSAVRGKDIVLQAITLNVLMLENQRLYNDLLKLPAPRGLKGPDLEKYATLLEQQASPYKRKAGQIYEKLVVVWTDAAWTEAMASNYTAARIEYKSAMKQDIEQLMKHSPSGKRALLEKAVKEPTSIPSEKAVAQVREKVRKNPFESSPVVELKDLEARRGNDIFVTHLDARLEQMKRVIR